MAIAIAIVLAMAWPSFSAEASATVLNDELVEILAPQDGQVVEGIVEVVVRSDYDPVAVISVWAGSWAANRGVGYGYPETFFWDSTGSANGQVTVCASSREGGEHCVEVTVDNAVGEEDARVRVLLERAVAGTITEAEAVELRALDAEAADQVPHPGGAELVNETQGPVFAPTEADAQSSTGTRCRPTSATFRMPSLVFRATLFRFTHEATYCWRNNRVTRVYDRRAYFTNSDIWTIRTDYARLNAVSGLNTVLANSRAYGRARNCVVRYGCIGQIDPWVRLNFRGNGSSYAQVGR